MLDPFFWAIDAGRDAILANPVLAAASVGIAIVLIGVWSLP